MNVKVACVGLALAICLAECGKKSAPTAGQFAHARFSGAAAGVKRHPGARRIYPYSVIPGGIENAAEARAYREVDPVVAAHYRDLSSEWTNAVADREMWRYASYRMDDRIYWTSHRIRIEKGERLLASGQERVRARCGNRLADTPRFPVRQPEPSLESMDQFRVAEEWIPIPELSPKVVPPVIAERTPNERGTRLSAPPPAPAPAELKTSLSSPTPAPTPIPTSPLTPLAGLSPPGSLGFPDLYPPPRMVKSGQKTKPGEDSGAIVTDESGPQAVNAPEPETWLMAFLGLGMIVFARRGMRRRRIRPDGAKVR